MVKGPNKRLNSWKEIADYLGRDVRTVSRWEKEFGLPIQRVGGEKGRSVFAFTDDVEEWLASRQPNGDPHPLSDMAAGSPPHLPVEKSRRVPRRWALLSACVILTGMVFLWTRNTQGSAVAGVHAVDDLLTAYSATRKPLWTAPFDDSVITPRPIALDLDKDGVNEIVAFNRGVRQTYNAPPRGAALTALSGSGRELWNFSPTTTLTFGTETFAGPWAGQAWTIAKNSSGPIFAVAVHHYTWWPGVVAVLNNKGKVLGEFVNSGWVTFLAPMQKGGKNLLLAGGISNSRDGAMLAVLDPAHPIGSSPEDSGSKYECRSCSDGKPLEYFVFSRSELNRTSLSRYNQVVAIDVFDDRVLVHVQEVDPTVVPTHSLIETIYEFTPDLQLRGFRVSDQYWDLHRRFELDGRLKHAAGDCGDRLMSRYVRTWNPAAGWIEVEAKPL
jgi:hypothetical protein